MCKVAGLTKVTDKNRENVWKFMIELGKLMSNYNKDGLGYAAFDKSGRLFGERWLHNNTAFTDFSHVKYLTPNKIERMYSFFGEKVLRSQAQAIILHTRMATCETGIHNTHPFVNNIENPTAAIIHNGIIVNDEEFEKKYSSCDSEVLVHLYDKHNVSEKLDNIKQVTAQLLGWYTVLNLVKTPQGQMILDIYTDAPRLNSFFIKELDTRIYATSATDIVDTAKKLGFSIKDHEMMKADTAKRIDVLTGEIIEQTKTNSKFIYTREPQQSNIVHASGHMGDVDFMNRWFGRKH